MITLQQVNSRFEKLFQMIVDLNICINNVERLAQNKYAHEESVKNHGFWTHHVYQLRFILIIQMCKVLSNNDNQKSSLIKMINCLENDNYDEEFMILLETNKSYGGSRLYKSREDIIADIRLIRNELNNLDDLITKVTKLRNKFYAHYDSNAALDKITFIELRQLVDFASGLFNRIRGKLINTNVDFSHTGDWNVDYILKELNDNKKTKQDRIQNKLKSRES